MLRFEADEKCFVHTGDFRNHGRKGKKLLETISSEFSNCLVDVLIIEGTMMSRNDEKYLSEYAMEKIATNLLLENRYAFLICSSTNIDSMASFYGATVRAGKIRSKNEKKECKPALICNSYILEQLKTYKQYKNDDDWHLLFHRCYPIVNRLNHIINGKTQKDRMIEDGFTMIVGTSDYYQELMDEFENLNPKPIVIYSMWDGYLSEGKVYSNEKLIDLKKKYGDRFVHLHTSGHATRKALAEVIKAINPREKIVPVHTEYARGFYELNIPKEMKKLIDIDLGCVTERFAAKNDCRAIKQNGYLWKSLFQGKLVTLVNLVKEKEDLELCFRGNSSADVVVVYYNNHEFIRIQEIQGNDYLMTCNEVHSRYYEDREKKLDTLNHAINADDFAEIYNIRKEFMQTLFSEEYTKDYMKDPKGVELTKKKNCKYEKQEQQKLFTANTNRQDGYYIYDMEYAQAFQSKAAKTIYEVLTQNEKHNHPDSLAIRYEKGRPVALVFIELKTTKSAMGGACSFYEHIKGMRNFVSWDCKHNNKEFINNRLNEAHEVMQEYQLLGLHECGDRPIEDFKCLPIELLLVITDNEQKNMSKSETAYDYYKKRKKKIDQTAKENNCDIIILPHNEFTLNYGDIIKIE